MRTILVTGSNGFVGKHLIRELHENGNKVIGIGGPTVPGGNPVEEAYLSAYHVCDLTDAEQVAKIDFSNVDAVIHLAGLASMQFSFAQPARFIGNNGAMTINLLEALMQQKVAPRVVVVSSSSLYDPLQPLPVAEDGSLSLTSPYGVSKLLTEQVCEYYRTQGLECIVVRPFNHIGPGQGPGFLLPDLAGQITEAAHEGKDLLVGNLTSKRDYTDVRDVAKAYRLLATADTLENTLYNVCSGKSIAGDYFLEKLLALLAPSKTLNVVVDETRFRPNDIADIRGDASRIHRETGWIPTIPLEQTVADFVAALKK